MITTNPMRDLVNIVQGNLDEEKGKKTSKLCQLTKNKIWQIFFGIISCEERAASLSRLSDCSPTPPGTKSGLARTLSFREQARSQCTFRACDLVKGELLGKGFFGQVNIISHFLPLVHHHSSINGSHKKAFIPTHSLSSADNDQKKKHFLWLIIKMFGIIYHPNSRPNSTSLCFFVLLRTTKLRCCSTWTLAGGVTPVLPGHCGKASTRHCVPYLLPILVVLSSVNNAGGWTQSESGQDEWTGNDLTLFDRSQSVPEFLCGVHISPLVSLILILFLNNWFWALLLDFKHHLQNVYHLPSM